MSAFLSHGVIVCAVAISSHDFFLLQMKRLMSAFLVLMMVSLYVQGYDKHCFTGCRIDQVQCMFGGKKLCETPEVFRINCMIPLARCVQGCGIHENLVSYRKLIFHFTFSFLLHRRLHRCETFSTSLIKKYRSFFISCVFRAINKLSPN